MTMDIGVMLGLAVTSMLLLATTIDSTTNIRSIDELDLEPCCALKFYPNIEICNTQIEGDIQDKIKEEQQKMNECFGDDFQGRLR